MGHLCMMLPDTVQMHALAVQNLKPKLPGGLYDSRYLSQACNHKSLTLCLQVLHPVFCLAHRCFVICTGRTGAVLWLAGCVEPSTCRAAAVWFHEDPHTISTVTPINTTLVKQKGRLRHRFLMARALKAPGSAPKALHCMRTACRHPHHCSTNHHLKTVLLYGTSTSFLRCYWAGWSCCSRCCCCCCCCQMVKGDWPAVG